MKSHYFVIFGITKHKFYNLENKIKKLLVFINRSNVLKEHAKQYFLDLIRVIKINISKLKFFEPKRLPFVCLSSARK